MKLTQTLVILIIGAGLWACSSVTNVYVQRDRVPVTSITEPDSTIQDFVAPYKKELSHEMDRIIGYAPNDIVRARPEGKLGNFVTDATMDYLIRNEWIPSGKYICLMNHGGLRAPLSKGQITVGDIYKLMPFDNTVVLAKLPMNALDTICDYLRESGGEPISGFQVTDSTCALNYENEKDTLFVVTTDYLFNGGDNMSFFQMKYSHQNTGVFLRDMLLEEVEKNDTIHPVIENRIKL